MTDRYDVLSARTQGEKTYWTKIGVAFPMRNKDGFNIIFEALPIPQMREGKLECTVMMMPPKPKGDRQGGGDSDGDHVPF